MRTGWGIGSDYDALVQTFGGFVVTGLMSRALLALVLAVSGALVLVTTLKPDGSADRTEPFAKGWLNEETGEYSGRPVDVAELADGSLLVSDDYAGAIYRISYSAP